MASAQGTLPFFPAPKHLGIHGKISATASKLDISYLCSFYTAVIFLVWWSRIRLRRFEHGN
jgi:hypothetical protein